MRHISIFHIMAFAAFLASCTDENALQPENGQEGGYYTINAEIVGNPGGTKTHMGALSGTTYPVYWSSGDKIALVSEGTTEFTIDEPAANSTHATFGGNAASIVGPFPGTEVFPAGYPSENAFAELSEGDLLVGSYLPYSQKFESGTFADNVYAMAGLSTDALNYQFHNLCGIVQLQIKASEEGQYIRQVNLTGGDGETIAGGIALKYDPETGNVIPSTNSWENGMALATYGDEAYTRVVIDFSGVKAGDTDAAGNTITDKDGMIKLSTTDPMAVNIAVIPQVFSKGFQVEMVDGLNFGSAFKFAVDNTVIKRSMVTVFEVFEYVAPPMLETANAYVYEDAGYYLMPAYAMGNRLDLKVVPDGVDHSELAVDLLWSDMVDGAGNLLDAITNISYVRMDDGNDMIQFKVEKDPYTGQPYKGNAVIALYNTGDNTIYWSWHLWLGDYKDVITGGTCADGSYTGSYPDGSPYNYQADATKEKLIIMDRNIGAISATPTDGWKTYGLLFQNGRKDPFPGADYNVGTVGSDTFSKFSNETLSAHVEEGAGEAISAANSSTYSFTLGMATKTWYNETLAPSGWIFHNGYQTATETIQNPMTFSSGLFTNNNGQWSNCSDSDNKSWMDPDLESNSYNSGTMGHGHTGLKTIGHEAYWNRTKTIFDPCPAGYSVLGERNGAFFGKKNETKTLDTVNHGYTTSFTYGGTTYNTWWPAAGVRTSSGQLADVGYTGLYFFYDHMAATHGGHGMSFTAGAGGKNEITIGTTSNHAGSIRCVRARQFDSSGNPIGGLKE